MSDNKIKYNLLKAFDKVNRLERVFLEKINNSVFKCRSFFDPFIESSKEAKHHTKLYILNQLSLELMKRYNNDFIETRLDNENRLDLELYIFNKTELEELILSVRKEYESKEELSKLSTPKNIFN